MIGPALPLALLLLAATVASPPALGAERRAAQRAAQPAAVIPPDYERAQELLAAGDTAAALDLLQAVTRSSPRFGPAFLRLGAVLTALAGEAEYDFGDRLAASRAIRRAFDLMGPDPELILVWGMLMRKQHIRVDALRTIETAVRRAGEQGTEFAPELVARMHYELGRIYEVWWEEVQNRCLPGRAPRECWFASAANAVACAEVPRVHVHIADRGRMMEHFRAALRLDPGNVDAALRLLGHLADQDDWAEYNALASQLVAASPLDPWPRLMRGLGSHHVGRSDLAERDLERALLLLPADELAGMKDIGPLLHPRARRAYEARDEIGRREVERIFFTATDPMYLTDVEERWVEHFARNAWVDVKYSSLTAGLRGWDTHRGEIYIRYGKPDIELQAGGSDGSMALCRPELFEVSAYYGYGIPLSEDQRRIAWDYVMFYEWFLFARNPTYRNAVFDPSELGPRHRPLDRKLLPPEVYKPAPGTSWQWSAGLSVFQPQFYRPRTITAVSDYAHQVARFRGTHPELVRFEVYAAPPAQFLGVAAGDSLTTGLFLHDLAFHPVWQHRRDVALEGAAVALDYRVEVPPGAYFYSLEARATAPDSVPRPLARARRRFAGETFAPDRVSLSDVLLADSIVPRTTMVTRRAELEMRPSYTTVFRPGEPVAIYFEIYGLAADPDGYGHFRIDLQVADSAGPGVMTRFLRGVQDLMRLGPQRGTHLDWERVVAIPEGDDRIPEYLTLELPELGTGTYRVQIDVTDLRTGQSATTQRYFIVDPAPRLRPAAQPGEVGLDILLPDPKDMRGLLHWLITGERAPPDSLPTRDPTGLPVRVPPPDTLAGLARASGLHHSLTSADTEPGSDHVDPRAAFVAPGILSRGPPTLGDIGGEVRRAQEISSNERGD